MATIVDVAKKSGVSISTVSYVLSGVRPVSEKTRRRVMDAMDELGYRPHAHAKALASRRSNILALVFPPGARGLGETELEIVTESVAVMRERGYHMVLWTCDYDDRRELTRLVRQGLVDGLILMEVHERDRRVEYLEDMGMPFALIGRTSDSERHACVDIDFAESFNRAVGYLVSCGHRNLALVNQSQESWDSGYGPSRRARSSFEAACKAAGCRASHYFCNPTPKDGFALAHEMEHAGARHTALLVMNDRALPGLVEGLSRLGVHVPHDLSIIAMISSPRMASSYVTPLTALEIPTRALVEGAVDALVAQLEGAFAAKGIAPAATGNGSDTARIAIQNPEGLLLPCTLVQRASTCPADPAARI